MFMNLLHCLPALNMEQAIGDLASRVLGLPAMQDAILAAVPDADEAFDTLLACHFVARMPLGPGMLQALARREAPDVPACADFPHTVPALRSLARAVGVRSGGKKAELLGRLGTTLAGAAAVSVPPAAYVAVRDMRLARRLVEAERVTLQPDERMCKSRALDTYALTPDELDCVHHIVCDNPHYRCAAPMLVFERRDLDAAATAKYGSLARARLVQIRKRGVNLRETVALAERAASIALERRAAAARRREALVAALGEMGIADPGALIREHAGMASFCREDCRDTVETGLRTLVETFAAQVEYARRARTTLEGALADAGVADPGAVIAQSKNMGSFCEAPYRLSPPDDEAAQLVEAYVDKQRRVASQRARRVAMRAALAARGFGRTARELDDAIKTYGDANRFCGMLMGLPTDAAAIEAAANRLATQFSRHRAIARALAARRLDASRLAYKHRQSVAQAAREVLGFESCGTSFVDSEAILAEADRLVQRLAEAVQAEAARKQCRMEEGGHGGGRERKRRKQHAARMAVSERRCLCGQIRKLDCTHDCCRTCCPGPCAAHALPPKP